MPSIHGFIKKDIRRCEEALKSTDVKKVNNLLREFLTAYKMYWNDLHFSGLGGWEDDSVSYVELRGFKSRLQGLLNLTTDQLTSLMTRSEDSKISNTNIISNQVSVNLEVLIQTTVEYFEENETLSDEERLEILDNINSIKKIGESEETKVKKWTKLKPILKWLSTKGVDIFIKLIPLIIEVLK